MEPAKRKPNRLKNYDYSTSGAYFITICINDRKNLFWCDVGANCVRQSDIQLSSIGNVVKHQIEKWNTTYGNVHVDKYVIMPNHLHLIICISTDGNRRTQFAPTISRMVKQFKGAVTKQIGIKIWQRSFHDHIIRDENDYLKIWQYIDTNPLKWQEDCFYTEE